MKITERVFNVSTSETVDNERDETVAEKKTREAIEKQMAKDLADAEAKATQRQAIADRLGLTADELKLLIG